MKLKVLILGTGLTLFGLASCGAGEEHTADTETTTTEEPKEEMAKAANYAINADASSIVWHGDALAGAYAHAGTLNISEGSLDVAGGAITGGSFTVDMTSMAATDENYTEEKTPEALIDHLSSGDFFEVEAHPTATFTITKVDGSTVMGDLTIRGVTKPATIKDVSVEDLEGSITTKGNLEFNRQDFGVAYDAGKDFVISNDIQLEITVEASK